MSNFSKYALLVLTIFTGAGPGLVSAFASAGLPSWAHALSVALSAAGAATLLFTSPPKPPSSTAVSAIVMSLAIAIGAVAGSVSCTAAQGQEVKTVLNDVAQGLTDSQLACAAATPYVSIPVIAMVCGIDMSLAPALDALLTQAETIGARKAKHVPLAPPAPAEAGPSDAARDAAEGG